MKIINHRLHRDDGTPYAFRASPHTGPTIKPRWLVMHYTASANAAGAINWFADPLSKVSAHVVIAKDGTITQCVPFNRKANHAGESAWKGVQWLNGHSIGIELDGYGYLGTAGPGKWKFGNKSIPDSDVVVATHKFGKPSGGWPKYPQAQLDAALELAKLLVREYRLEDVVGHDDIAPGRKQDPGPTFPMDSFRASATKQPDSAARVTPPAGLKTIPRFRVKTTLNVRSGPAAANATVAGSPLQAGTIVRGAEDQAGWKRITAEGSSVSGWVSAQFLEPVPAELFTVTADSLNVRGGPGAANPTVPGSPLTRNTVVQALEEANGWKRVVSLGAAQVTGWVSAQYLAPAVVPVSDVGQPANV
ncbi:MAG: N-acetylmuramoyl-L-alanine amidase [Gemmatimonadetes bacterium]|nr:N-acetylmuramoyl-L-alanine amidase [Gemmatimonadota bacterium]